MTTLIAALAAPAALDRHVDQMMDDQPTLSDIASVLHLLGNADDVDGVRIQALCDLAARALGKFDAYTRTAPADELAAVVRDAQQPCAAAHLGCVENVLPWIFDGEFCSPTCRADHMRDQRETWADDPEPFDMSGPPKHAGQER